VTPRWHFQVELCVFRTGAADKMLFHRPVPSTRCSPQAQLPRVCAAPSPGILTLTLVRPICFILGVNMAHCSEQVVAESCPIACNNNVLTNSV